MKHFIAILCAITILSFAKSTFGDGDVNCPITSTDEANNLNLNDIMLDRLHECFEKTGELNLQTIKEVFSTDPRNIFEEYCEKKDLINDCLSTTSVSSSDCHNETEHKVVGFVEDMLKTALNYGCVEHGKQMATLMLTVFRQDHNSTVERNAMTDCFDAAKSQFVKGNNLDLSKKMLGFYREMKEFKHCLINEVGTVKSTVIGRRGLNKAVFGVEFIMNGILRSMKCIHAETGTTVLCETLDRKACPFVGENVNESPDSEIFFDLTTECVVMNLNQLNFDKLKTFSEMAEYKTFFHTYCQNQLVIKNCFADVSSISKTCQNQTEDQLVDLLREFFEHLVEYGCKQDGDTLAVIFSGIFTDSESERAVSNETKRVCMDKVQEVLKDVSYSTDSDTYPHRILGAYRAYKTLKKCVMDGASDVGSFKPVFDSYTNDILRTQNCLHQDTGAKVLCESIVNDVVQPIELGKRPALTDEREFPV